jgi:hypothetical protein
VSIHAGNANSAVLQMTHARLCWGLSIFVFKLLCAKLDGVSRGPCKTMLGTLYICFQAFVCKVGWSESRQTTRIAEQSTRSLTAILSQWYLLPASQGRAGDMGPVNVNSPQAIVFKCLYGAGGVGSRTAMDVHRRHRSTGTSNNAQSVSYVTTILK